MMMNLNPLPPITLSHYSSHSFIQRLLEEIEIRHDQFLESFIQRCQRVDHDSIPRVIH